MTSAIEGSHQSQILNQMGLLLTASAGGGSKLPAGNHVGLITVVEVVASEMTNKDGSAKHPWTDSVNQLKLSIEVGSSKVDAFQPLAAFKGAGSDLSLECKNISVARLKALGVSKADWIKLTAEKQIDMLFTFEQADEYGDQSKVYAVYAAGEKVRVQDPEKTKACLEIAGRIGAYAGIAGVDEDFDTDDLVGNDIGIEVTAFTHKSGKTYSKVTRFMTVQAVHA